MELHGQGARLIISLKHIYKDVADWYQLMFYGLGYHDKESIKMSLERTNSKGKQSSYL